MEDLVVPPPKLDAGAVRPACQQQQSYLKALVEQFFGEQSAAVIGCMISNDPLMFGQILRLTGLKRSVLASDLTVLIQHGLVKCSLKTLPVKATAEATADKAIAPRPAVYTVDDGRIAMLARIAKFGVHLGIEIAPEAENLVELLAEHGKLTKRQLEELFVAQMLEANSEAGVAQVDDEQCRQDMQLRVKTVLDQLINENYFSISAAIEESINLDLVNDESTAKRRRLDEKGQTDCSMNGEEHVYEISRDLMIFIYRRTIVREIICSRVNARAATVAVAMLAAPNASIQASHQSPAFSEILLYSRISSKTQLSRENLRAALEEMTDPRVGFVTIKHSQTTGDLYVLDMQKIVEVAQTRVLATIVGRKFGKPAARVFRLLLDRKWMEEKAICDACLVSKQDVHSCLSKMLHDGFVRLQEIPKSGDRHPRRTIFMWSVKLEEVRSHLLTSLYFAYVNTRVRLLHEMKKVQPILDKLGGNDSVGDALTNREQILLTGWRSSSHRLETALQHLDDEILLFRDL